MEEILLLTIIPFFATVTIFLFNLGIKETIDYKYGLNTYYFKPISIILSIGYILFFMSGLFFAKNQSDIKSLNIRLLIVIAPLIIVYLIMFILLNKEREKLLFTSEKIKPNKKKANVLIIVGILLMLVFSFITSYILKEEIMSAISMLANKNSTKDYFFLMKTFMSLFICYFFTISASGYTYNYGQLHDFRKYRLIIDELEKILDALNIKDNKKFIDVYVLAESEESMMIKFCEKELPAVSIKKEHILNVLFIDERKVKVRKRIKKLK